MKDLKRIRNEMEYEAALAEASYFVDHEPAPGSKKADRFEVLLMLIESYEAKHYPIDLPDPIEAIKFRMEQAGLKPKDLQPMIGGLNRFSISSWINNTSQHHVAILFCCGIVTIVTCAHDHSI